MILRAASSNGRVVGGDCGWVATADSRAVAGRSLAAVGGLLAPAVGNWVAARRCVATAGSRAVAHGQLGDGGWQVDSGAQVGGDRRRVGSRATAVGRSAAARRWAATVGSRAAARRWAAVGSCVGVCARARIRSLWLCCRCAGAAAKMKPVSALTYYGSC
jgi:hypothetical protein